jgi:hypothetical protein
MTRLLTGSTARRAANVATVAFAVAAVLQLLLAIGRLPSAVAWGGSQPVLTVPLRLASVFGPIALVAAVSCLLVVLVSRACPRARAAD